MDGSIYFVTFCAYKTVLDENERRIVLEHIKEGGKKVYDCYAVVVMPDHVHMLFQPKEGISLSRIMHGIKGVGAYKVNRYRKTKGVIWQKESFDRIIGDGKEFDIKLNYTYNNPIKKGLIEKPNDYIDWYYNEKICR